MRFGLIAVAAALGSVAATKEVVKTVKHRVYDENGAVVPSRYDYKFTFKHPFTYSDNRTVPYFDTTEGNDLLSFLLTDAA